MIWRRPLCFVNGRVHADGATASSLRCDATVLSVDEPPRHGDVVVDLEGAHVLPGLINAHDHLELNHYGRLKFRDAYRNASEWIDDMRPRLEADAGIRANRSFPLRTRLFAGVIKNLLAGVTTVAHHNPLYPELRGELPIRVVHRYGWAHSFYLEAQPSGARGELGGTVEERHRATPERDPFFVHAAEGTDAVAAREIARLESASCLGANVVLVHGLAMTARDCERVRARRASVVWCPGSNRFLFNGVAPIRRLRAAGAGGRVRVALGSDSRLSGERDLLEEARAALATGEADADDIFRMVTTDAAIITRMPVGRLSAGAPADVMILPAGRHNAPTALLSASRRDVRLVVVGGQPRVGGAEFAAAFRARRVPTASIRVEEAERIVDARIARHMRRSPIQEPGVTTA